MLLPILEEAMKQLIILSILAFALTACEKKADDSGAKTPQAVKPAAEKPTKTADDKPAVAKAETPVATAASEKVVAIADKAAPTEAKTGATTAEADGAKTAEAGPGCGNAGCGGCGGGDDALKAEAPKDSVTTAEAGPGCGGCGGAGEVAKTQVLEDSVKTAEAGLGCGSAGCGGCGGGGEVAPVVAGGTHYGSDFSLADDAIVALTKVMGAPDDYNGKNVRVAASVNKVCKAKGCWFVLQGEEGDKDFVRVTMSHKFFVPTDCIGKKAVVEGIFRKVELPESKVAMTLIASAVQLKD
ncbi:MAG: hypothetical protein ACI9OJ_002567 [Myxococcota bacterium]|jgi:hypothetical protein